MPADLPDLLVIGDSHSNALVEGAAALGLRVEMLRFSGNIWHSGRVVAHADHGLWVRGLRAMQAEILALRDRLGGRPVLSREVPVLGAFGYHLGRLVPPMGFAGHVADAAAFDADPGALAMSQAFVDAYVAHHRAGLVRLARTVMRACPLVVVVPPRAFDRPNYAAVRAAITRQLRAGRVDVHDPAPDLCGEGVLDPGYLMADGTHGNARYGAAVIAAMQAAHRLPRAG